jgi:hypothetical protein
VDYPAQRRASRPNEDHEKCPTCDTEKQFHPALRRKQQTTGLEVKGAELFMLPPPPAPHVFGRLGLPELLVILVIVIIVFGVNRLPPR